MGNLHLHLPHDKKDPHNHDKMNTRYATHHHDGYSDGKHFHLYDKDHGDHENHGNKHGESHTHSEHGNGNIHNNKVPVDVESIDMEDTADPTIYMEHSNRHEYISKKNESKHAVFGVFFLVIVACIILVIVFA